MMGRARCINWSIFPTVSTTEKPRRVTGPGRVTIQFFAKTRTFLRVKGDAIDKYARIIGIN